MSDLSLVHMHHNQPMTTSMAIAEGVKMEHASILKLIRNHAESLANFGGVGFEIQPFDTAGGKQWRDVYFLNEPQSTLLITFMRNSEIVIAFKIALVKAFYELRDLVQSESVRTAGPSIPAHEADRMVAADRTFRSVLRVGRAAGISLGVALRQANKVALVKTGVDILSEIDAESHVKGIEASEAARNQSAFSYGESAYEIGRFISEWLDGQLPVPAVVCRSRELTEAYLLWCKENGSTPAPENVFIPHAIRNYGLRRKMARIGEAQMSARLIMPPCSVPPRVGEGVGLWVADQAMQFSEALSAWKGAE